MLQLAYISTCREKVDQALLDSILAVSRRNNVAAGISGLLVSGGKRFLQVLEGPDQAVLATYGRIQGDLRHRSFVLINCQSIGAPAFGDWSMAYREGGMHLPDDKLQDAVEKLTSKIADPNLRAQFAGFAKLHAHAA